MGTNGYTQRKVRNKYFPPPISHFHFFLFLTTPAPGPVDAPAPASPYAPIALDSDWSQGGGAKTTDDGIWKQRRGRQAEIPPPHATFLDTPHLGKPSSFPHLLHAKLESVAIFKEGRKDSVFHFRARVVRGEKSSGAWAFSGRFLSDDAGGSDY